MSDILLQTQGLGVSFGGVHAVRDVDFRLERGEIRCLIGPNGAGKSTFFKMLSGQLRPSRGIHFRGRPLRGLPTHEVARLGIGIKTQVPSVFEGLDVRENLLLAAARRRGRTARLPSPTRSWPRPAWATWPLRPSTRWRTASASGWSWA